MDRGDDRRAAAGSTAAITEFYGANAGLYDRIATLPPVGRWRARIADALALDPGDTVVEMGCGTGANLPFLRERVGTSGRVVGVDLTEPLLSVARERVASFENVHVLRADATAPPVRQADAVLATFVVGLLPDPSGAVGTWCDLVAARGGRVALADATASRHVAGRLLNPAFRAFVAAGAPSAGVGDIARAFLPGADLDAPLTDRVRASRRALTARATDRRYETMGLGFVGVLSGRLPHR